MCDVWACNTGTAVQTSSVSVFTSKVFYNISVAIVFASMFFVIIINLFVLDTSNFSKINAVTSELVTLISR